MIKRFYLGTAFIMGMMSSAVQAFCPPEFNCVNAMITPLPVVDSSTIAQSVTEAGERVTNAAASAVQSAAKNSIQMAKSAVKDSLTNQKAPEFDSQSLYSFGKKDVSSSLGSQFPSPKMQITIGGAKTESDADKQEQATAQTDANKSDEAVKTIEKSLINNDATEAGVQYENKRRAYMTQENVIDVYAKVFQATAALDDLIDQMDKMDATAQGNDVNAALRNVVALAGIANNLESLRKEVLAARLQLRAYQGLDQVGTLQNPVMTEESAGGAS